MGALFLVVASGNGRPDSLRMRWTVKLQRVSEKDLQDAISASEGFLQSDESCMQYVGTVVDQNTWEKMRFFWSRPGSVAEMIDEPDLKELIQLALFSLIPHSDVIVSVAI